MADANPGIGGLGAATALTLEEFRGRPAASPGKAREGRPGPRAVRGDGSPREEKSQQSPRAEREPAVGRDGVPGPVSWRQGQPPPNLGPPPERLDWRKRRS